MWSPLGDVSLDMGCLALVPSSHNQEAFTRFQVRWGHEPSLTTPLTAWVQKREVGDYDKCAGRVARGPCQCNLYYIVIDISLQATYGECDLEKEGVTGSGWFTENPREIQKMSV